MYKRPLTEEEFATAKLNGIPRARVHARYYNNDWTVERAITEPLAKRGNSEHTPFLVIAKENGISRTRYYERIAEGMSKEDACTIPTKRGRSRSVMTDEQAEIAKSNGLYEELVRGRLKLGWDIERAITDPPQEFWVRNSGKKKQILVGNY